MASSTPVLPPGFRFHPTDEELIVHYLMNQAASIPCPVSIIAEVDIYKSNPWDLPGKALFGEKEWYFFSPRERKYPNGARPNRAAASGYWKATGTDKAILSTPQNENIGVKKALVFYKGKPPKGAKTDWIMHEYRLTTTNKSTTRRGSPMRLDDWVLCRIYKKSNNLQCMEQEQEGSTVEDTHDIQTSPKIKPSPFDTITKSCSLTDLLNIMDYSALSQLLDMSPDVLPEQSTSPLIHAIAPYQTINYKYNSMNNQIPPQDTGLYDANNDMKRKRLMNSTASSLEDGNNFSHVAKKLVLPSDSRNSNLTNASYCNQPEESFQYKYFLSQPFLNEQLL